jgi:predicted 3-demethylubiquinone-9 3-methyltransferase (glyoxalase superfamily)
MQHIIPHLWFDKEATEATALYASLFQDSTIKNVSTIKDTPSGDCDMVSFQLCGQEFMAISAGPYFKLNPSISFFVSFGTEIEIETVWNALIEGGKALMPYDTYPWAQKYGWLEDKYGVSWQLSLNEHPDTKQKITPFLMFTKDKAGKVKEALEMYTAVFPHSHIDLIIPYTKDDGDTEGLVKHARFTLNGNSFMAMESTLQHDFTFNESISFIVYCDTQEEIDYYWEKLSFVPEAEQCGWLKDKYGVSWQIIPRVMNEMLSSADKEKVKRVTEAFLKMKKFDIKQLEAAYSGA